MDRPTPEQIDLWFLAADQGNLAPMGFFGLVAEVRALRDFEAKYTTLCGYVEQLEAKHKRLQLYVEQLEALCTATPLGAYIETGLPPHDTQSTTSTTESK